MASENLDLTGKEGEVDVVRDEVGHMVWSAPLLSGTPGDPVAGGGPRQVPGACWSRCEATPMPEARLRLWNADLATTLSDLEPDPDIWVGQRTLEGMDPHAHRYGGHQFGNWAHQLGDGRAITLGHIASEEGPVEIQLKGAGRTPYSRHGDGRAVLRSSLREYLCSEAMHHLGVPSSRALALCTTGEEVRRDMFYDGRPAMEPGAIIVRTAPSFVRFGSFQILTADGDETALRALMEHIVETHDPDHSVDDDAGVVAWLNEVAERSAAMVCGWMRHGFVHGVMNTDNMSIHGLTIDYGPFGWLEAHDPTWTPNTTDLPGLRYRYAAQPDVVGWNLARLLEAIAPAMEDAEQLRSVLDRYREAYAEARRSAWVERLGLEGWRVEDEVLVRDLQVAMHSSEVDHVPMLRQLAEGATSADALITSGIVYATSPDIEQIEAWLACWLERTEGHPDLDTMRRTVPVFTPRNWVLQLAIDDAERGDWGKAEALDARLKRPFEDLPEDEGAWWSGPRPDWALTRAGCSTLSCSS